MTVVLPHDWNNELLAVFYRPNTLGFLIDKNNRTPSLVKIDPRWIWCNPTDFLSYLGQNPVLLAQVVMLINESHLGINKNRNDYIQLYGSIKSGKLIAHPQVYPPTPAQTYGSNTQYYPPNTWYGTNATIPNSTQNFAPNTSIPPPGY